MRASSMARNISSCVGSHPSSGLGVPPGVITRAQLSQMSTWLLVSPMYGMICGWVAFTWNASQNASCAIFQFALMTLATWASL